MNYSLQAFINRNIDAFIGKYINNPLKIRDTLYALQSDLKETNKHLNLLTDQSVKAKLLIKKYQANEELAKSEIKKLREENDELKEKVTILQSLIEVDNQIKIYKYIADKTYIDGDIAEQYITTLLKCKVIKQKDYEEIINKSNASNRAEEQKEHSDNLVQMFKDLHEPTTEEQTVEDDFEYISMEELNAILDD